jgi:ATP-dependent Clp protease ATP-binding subunit ClpC
VLTDGKGRFVDFSNTVIIAMSNVGASKITDDPVQPESTRMSEKVLREGLLQVLKKHFRPEFLSASMR